MLSLYLGFSLLHESLSPSCAVLLSVLPGLKSFAAIWSCLSLGKKKKKLGFFHKWLYHVEKANTSAHCWSHKTSESAAGWGPQSCRLTRYETL